MILSPVYPLIVEIVFYCLFAVAVYAASLRFGRPVTGLLLVGSMIYTIVIENFIVLNGGYDYFVYAKPNFLGYMVWAGVVPLWIILGWFIMTTTSYILADTVFPGRRPYFRALVASLISLNIDLLLDPVAVSTGLWRWTHPSVYILGVPLTNLIGWPLIVYFFVLAFDTSVMRGTKVGAPVLSDYGGGWWGLLRSFLRRLLIVAPIVIVATFVVLVLLIPYSNVSPPFKNIFPAPGAWWS